MPQQSLLPPRSHLWVALAAFCGCPPFGVPAIVYAILAEVKQREGQREEAFILADRAWYWIRLAAVSILVLLALLGTWLLRRS